MNDERWRKVVGMDLNGVWDWSWELGLGDAGARSAGEADLGARSVAVRALGSGSEGADLLMGGREALESVYGRGREFGKVGEETRRREVEDAWREIRGEDESEATRAAAAGLLKEGGSEDPIAADDVLRAQAQAALGPKIAQGGRTARIGLAMRDDRATTEEVQSRVRNALDWRSLDGARTLLVWDSVAVAKGAIEEDEELSDGDELWLVASYGKRVHEYRLRVCEQDGTLVPVRERDLGRAGSLTLAEAAWEHGWEESFERLRGLRDPELRAVVRQTRMAEGWTLGEEGKALIRSAGRWGLAKKPEELMKPLGEGPRVRAPEGCARVLVWTPVGGAATEALAERVEGGGRIVPCAPGWAALGAALAARDMEEGRTPWRDRLERMTLRINRQGGDHYDKVLIDDGESVPAGAAYRTDDERAAEISRRVYMDEHNWEWLRLPIRKGPEGNSWGKTKELPLPARPKGHTPVEVRARQSPGQGWAELEIRAPKYPPWGDAAQVIRFERDDVEKEDVLPELIEFEPATEAWTDGVQIVAVAAADVEAGKMDAWKAVRVAEWLQKPLGTPPLNRRYAIGTEGGAPERTPAGAKEALEAVRAWAAGELLERVRDGDPGGAKQKALNALHRIHTWSFASADPDVLEALLYAAEGRRKPRKALLWMQDGAKRAVWQGLGRSVTTRDAIERVVECGTAAGEEEAGTWECDAIAALSHLLARRKLAGELVLDEAELIKRIARIGYKESGWAAKNIRERTPDFRMRAGLQLRYSVLLIGGLARVKWMGAECLEAGTRTAAGLAQAMEEGVREVERQDAWGQAKGLKPIMQNLAAVFGKDATPDRNLLKEVGVT